MRRVFYITSTILMVILMSIQGCGSFAASADETPEAVYYGSQDAASVMKNLGYSDIGKLGESSKLAIYEAGALGVVNRYGSKSYLPYSFIPKEEALACIYAMAGREAEARKMGEALNAARKAADKKTDVVGIWMDGFLQMALKDKLITAQDFADSQNPDQAKIAQSGFHRDSPAQRQEVADWIARVLGLVKSSGATGTSGTSGTSGTAGTAGSKGAAGAAGAAGVSGQNKLFNNYKDWKQADESRIAGIESMLEHGIMNGDSKGFFSPKTPVTREQMALIVRNAENVFFPFLNLYKMTGAIESIKTSGDNSSDKGKTTVSSIDIRRSNGMLHKMILESGDEAEKAPQYNNEKSGASAGPLRSGLLVYSGGRIGDAGVLKKGDRIEYVVAPDNTVKFVRVISNISDTKYIGAQIDAVNTNTRTMSVTKLFSMNFPDAASGYGTADFNMKGGPSKVTYRYSNDMKVKDGTAIIDIGSVKPGDYVVLTVKNDAMIVETARADFNANGREGGMAKGIVSENNTSLGYIELFNENGILNDAGQMRIYYYNNPVGVDTYKDGVKIDIDGIEPGDTVFLKLDGSGNILAASAADNYSISYGTVSANRNGALTVDFDGGDSMVIRPDSSVAVFVEGRPAKVSEIKDGDHVRVMSKNVPGSVKIKEIEAERNARIITNIYKGKVAAINDISKVVNLQEPQILDHDTWMDAGSLFNNIRLSDDCLIYSGGKLTDGKQAGRRLKGAEAYVAVEKAFDGTERAVILSFIDGGSAEDSPYDGIVSDSSPGGKAFSLSSIYKAFGYDDGSIIVKDGRLVKGSSIRSSDRALVLASQDDSGTIRAGVVKIDTAKADSEKIAVYRGRINAINDGKSFTLESFSIFGRSGWEFYNTPKTFTQNSGTVLVTGSGFADPRAITAYGSRKFTGQFVYVASDGADALLVSTAPFGNTGADSVVTRGTVYDVSNAQYNEDGTILQEPDTISIRSASNYNLLTHTWDKAPDMTLKLHSGGGSSGAGGTGGTSASGGGTASDSVIVKNGRIIEPSQLSKLDIIRVFRSTSSGSAGTTGTTGTTSTTGTTGASSSYATYVLVVEN